MHTSHRIRISGGSTLRQVPAYKRAKRADQSVLRTVQIKNTIDKVLEPHGVAVVIEAQHLCMMMRGVQKQNSSTTTSSFSGEFEKQATRMEFLKLLSNDLR